MRHPAGQDPTSRSVHLLLSYAVRYPEVVTVRYDPRRKSLRLGFLVVGPLPEADFAQVEALLAETLEVYLLLEQRRPAILEVSRESLGDLTAVGLERDIATLSPEEIYTVVELVKDRFAGRVVTDQPEAYGEEEMLAQEQMIEEMLESLSRGRSGANLYAIREDGRLMFFHK